MRIKATQVAAGTLVPGDLFSFIEPEYWQRVDDGMQVSLGEHVKLVVKACYVRGSMETPHGDEKVLVTKLEVER